MHDDKQLVRETLNGSKDAFEMIINRYRTPLFNYVGRMVNDRELALDLTQEVFIKTYSSLHQYRAQYKFSTWLYKIASNLVIDMWRKKKIDAFSIDQVGPNDGERISMDIPDAEPSVDRRFELTEARRKIEDALQRIPAHLRELFVWRHVNEFSYEEMADIKNLPIGTIKNRVFQAKEMVRRLIEEKS